jgi:hypothetical protein
MFTKASAEAYFNGEKSESLLFLIIGAIAIVAGLILFFAGKTDFNKGLAIPLVLVGILQCVVGYTVYSRSDKQRMDIVYKMDINPHELKQKEVPRMEKVMQQFKTYRYVEILLLVAGICLFLFLRDKESKQIFAGIGMGLAIQASLMLAADGFAEHRGGIYLQGLKSFVQEMRGG